MRHALAALLLCLFALPAQAQTRDDRYFVAWGGTTASDVVRTVRCPGPLRCLKGRHGKKHKRMRRHREPRYQPAPAAVTMAHAPEPLSVWAGVKREATEAVRRVISFGRPAGAPRAWCGFWLGRHLGKPDRKLWLARNWAREGAGLGGPAIGAVVVWPHHVGIITGKTAAGWVVKSGNDGHAVRERVRSVARAIAFRRV